jgi:uncharacterized membrane protein YhhN
VTGTGLSRSAVWLFAALAGAFVLSLAHTPYPGDFLLKVSPIACLLIAVSATGVQGRQWLIMAALLFCGIGDVSLERGHFSLGLGAFLVGHLFYLGAFCRQPEISVRKGLLLAGLAAYCAILVTFLAPHLGDMASAVFLYMTVIAIMAAAAITGRRNHPLVALGALLFVLSDSLIAVNRFVEPIPGARYWIMILYYSAQYLLTHDARAHR